MSLVSKSFIVAVNQASAVGQELGTPQGVLELDLQVTPLVPWYLQQAHLVLPLKALQIMLAIAVGRELGTPWKDSAGPHQS